MDQVTGREIRIADTDNPDAALALGDFVDVLKQDPVTVRTVVEHLIQKPDEPLTDIAQHAAATTIDLLLDTTENGFQIDYDTVFNRDVLLSDPMYLGCISRLISLDRDTNVTEAAAARTRQLRMMALRGLSLFISS
jgi:hypothetical protein